MEQPLNTHNTAQLCAFPPGPKTTRTQVPNLKDTQELYSLHKFVMKKHCMSGTKVLYEPGEALDYLTRYGFQLTYEEQVERGWLYYDQRNDYYRPTIKGAYFLSWSLMQPFKALRIAALHRRARAILEEFNQAQIE